MGEGFVIEPLDKHHDKADFSCGQAALDRYIKQQAGQDVRRNLARVFVVCAQNSKSAMGFYTLSATHIMASSMLGKFSHKLPKYPIPAVLIGRLAVDSTIQKKGVGKVLLADALKRIVRARHSVAMYAAIVDAKNEQACCFYRKFGFLSFRDIPKKLFLPLDTCLKAQEREKADLRHVLAGSL